MNTRVVSLSMVFAVTYCVIYIVAVWNNYALFTYHPVINEIGWGVEKSRDGPAMYWYGWMSTAALGAAGACLMAALLPQRLLQRLSPAVSWTIPLCVLLAIAYMLRNYFLR